MDAVAARNVTKAYRVGVGRARIREALPWPVDGGISRAFPRWWNKHTFNALDDLTLSIRPSSSVGIIGHNGAGKTTLLKVLAGVTAPSSGRVEVNGRVAALIDVLVGFHPDLTGRENVYLLGAIQRYGRRAMSAKLDEIMAFAEIDEMADTPLKRFSAGMITRLGFATLTALDIDVLLIDEVLAVGDAAFQRKCIDWLEGYRDGGGTLLFVSHNLGLVRNMTDRAVWLDHGKIVADGDTEEILLRYGRTMERRDADERGVAKGLVKKALTSRGMHRWGAGGARVEAVNVGDASVNGAGVNLQISYEAPDLDAAVICVGFIDESGAEVAAARSPILPVERGRGAITCTIRPVPFRSGLYFPVVAILSPDGIVRDRWRLDRALVVERPERELGEEFAPVGIPSDWSVSPGSGGSS